MLLVLMNLAYLSQEKPISIQRNVEQAPETGPWGTGSSCRSVGYTFVSAIKTMSSMLHRKSVTPASIAGVVLMLE
jgi:hypothetical protein